MEQLRSSTPGQTAGDEFHDWLPEAHPARRYRGRTLQTLGRSRRAPVRLALLEIIGRIDPDLGSEDGDLLVQLRAALAAVETRADRLQGRYRGWPSTAGLLYAKHRE
jgi:hypothetical protein